MTDDLAPPRSPRPAPRLLETTPEERRASAIARARANADAEAFAALEQRADMDPWLADDPLARLGYRELGGLRAVDYIPGEANASFLRWGANEFGGMSPARQRALAVMYPERENEVEMAWRRGEPAYW